MAKLQSLMASLEKAEAKVEKVHTTIDRYVKRLAKNQSALAKKGIELDYSGVKTNGVNGLEFAESKKDFENAKMEIFRSEKYDEYEIAYKMQCDLEGLNNAHKKLAEAEKVVSNWKVKFVAEQTRIDFAASAPKVIIDFVNRWGELAFEWMMANANFPNESNIRRTIENEKQIKIIQLTMRVTEVVGTIADAKGLSIGGKGDLEGIIIGDKGRARVETIMAGGWNIQCFHYRTLVHAL